MQALPPVMGRLLTPAPQATTVTVLPQPEPEPPVTVG
jgi:hypothetical protein